MTPLGITRAHLTPSTREIQHPDAVRHHIGGMGQADLTIGPSSLQELAIPWFWSNPPRLLRISRPLAGHAYGGGDYGFFDAFGAWCLAAADFARLLASFERTPHPLFTAASVTTMTTPVAIPGFTGWEGPSVSAGTSTTAQATR